MKAADEPAYLTVGTDVSAKYRGAFCEAKIKTVKRLVKVKVILKDDSSTLLVQDDQVKGPLRVGATVEMKNPEGFVQEAVVSKLTDASWYTVVFDDGDERTLRRTSLCLKGERHFAESETLDQLPLTNPEHFGTPVIGKKTNRGRRSSLPMTEDEKEEESSEDEDDDQRRLNDELLGKIVSVMCSGETTETPTDWYPALVVSPSCSDDSTTVKKDQCLVRSFADSKFYSVSRRDIVQLDILSLLKSEISCNQGLEEASCFFKTRGVPDNWKMDMSEILESSSSDDEDIEAEGSDEEKHKVEEEEKVETVPEEEPDPEERDNFLQQLYKFMEDRGTPINKPPVLGYKDLNLFKLFRLVYKHGGSDSIDSGSVWKQIYMDLGIPILNSAASYNVKTAYRKYLYGFEEYCRSANIQFRTIHHNDPKPAPVEEVRLESPMEDRVEVEPDLPPVEVKDELEESIDSSSDSEKEEDLELRTPRGRRKTTCDGTPNNKDTLDLDISKDSNEDKETIEELEQRESESPLMRKNMSRLKDMEDKEPDESEEESEEDDEGSREGSSSKDGAEPRGSDGGDSDSSLTGTKVKVKYGRGKAQKIYEANIKSTETDNGELLYLVHYYGWNVRYDEWVKADRIIWLSDKGGRKRKQRRRTKNKEESEVDERREEEKLRSRRGRPALKSSLLSNLACCLSKMPGSEGKLGARGGRGLHDSSPLSNGTEGPLRRRTRHSPGLYDSDQGSNDLSISISDSDSDEASEKMSVKDEFTNAATKSLEEGVKRVELEEPPHEMSLSIRESDRTPIKVLETLKQEVEESEQIVQIYENKSDPAEDLRKELEHSPKVKCKNPRTKDHSLESSTISIISLDESTESENETETRPAFLESKELFPTFEEESVPAPDMTPKDKVLKRRPLDELSPEKKMRIECEAAVPIIVGEENPDNYICVEECKDLDEDFLESERKEMPSLTAESDQHLPDAVNEEFATPPREMSSIAYKEEEEEEEDDAMPHIGPETLVCHEVDLDDFDDKYKNCEDSICEKSEPNTPTSDPPPLPTSMQTAYSEALLSLGQDESRSVKSESDITIEVDSVAEESQEGLCESESANGFEASTTSSNCSVTTQEKDIKDKGQKRSSEGNPGSTAKKLKRNAKRSCNASKIEKNGTGQSSDSEDLPTLDSKCTPSKHTNISKPQKLARSPARLTSPPIKDADKDRNRDKSQNAPTRTYTWSFRNEDLDNMTSSERITFLQDKLQEIRKYYLSLKSEVASIDRRRKRLKKKDREVAHPGASMSSASSETGMSPSSSSPPQNTVTVECR
ncbi:AT-rich interactive domain-containing protein 4A [Ambystoma mexicanum]|uniref:AT-rich interactive domain-containing protein 4A n=1 Tax=Ambystoma mexicanum TaxID=8296 RepID=UPI0037E779F0